VWLPRHGSRGPTGIYELLIMNDAIRSELPRARDVGELRALPSRRACGASPRTGMRLVGRERRQLMRCSESQGDSEGWGR